MLELWKDGTVMKAILFESYEVFRSVCSSQAPAFDADLCSIVVNATRYSLGRRTYMPSVVSDFIKRHISQLDDETLNRVISIVREYLNGEPQDPEISVWYSLLHTLSRWILEKSSRSDSAMMTLPKIETLERIDQKYLAEHLDETLDRVRKENIALVITKDGKDDLVLCPQSWVSPMVDDEFGCVVNSAIRHALRSDDSDSSGVLHFVLKNYKLFDERTLAVAISDIERDLDYPLFPVSSSESWLEIKELLSVWLKDLQAAKYRKGVQNDGEQR